MRNPTVALPGALCLALLLLPISFLTPSSAAQKSQLVVHEWGTFTSVTNKDGLDLSWRPLHVESDLPSFIYSIDKGGSRRDYDYPSKSLRPVRVRMETPVLYFYAKEQMTATVRVLFPGGKVTEWYPQGRHFDGGIGWIQLKIMPDLRVELAHDAKENHYYPARETDAAMLEVAGKDHPEYERFLFYRGVGNFALPLSLKLQGNKVTIKNTSGHSLSNAILFENTGGQIGFSLLSVPRDNTTIDRPVLDKQINNLRQEMKTMLVTNGLYEKEADAMLNTWFEEGLRIFYIMPREDTDAILPLSIEPQPDSLVRVLVGRTELITPEMERNVTSQLPKLSDQSPAVRAAARKEINRYGRFVESILSQVSAKATDPEIRNAAIRLMQEIN